MEKLNYLYMDAKPIFTTFVFELKQRWKKFIIFCGLSILFVLLGSYLPYALEPCNPIPDTQARYFQDGLMFLNFLIILTTCFFFGGIICAEFDYKTGYTVFPIINKYKLIIGKYLGSYILVIGVIGTFYFTLGLWGIYYYGGSINHLYYQSFLIVMLYALAICSFVALFSSFMKNVSMSIVATLMILLMANMMIDSLVVLLYPDFEPVYSLNHNFKLVSYIMESDFPTKLGDRYIDAPSEHGPTEGFEVRQWLTPTIEMGITIFLLYTVICLVVASLIFKRKQL
jgi:ABC-type transport system involved in multi-copper enzyme maturation permease subunit